MDITEQDAFKLGFLTRCAEEKLTGDSLEARLDQVASFNKRATELVKVSPVTVGGGTAADMVGSAGKSLVDAFQMITAVPIAGSIIGGAGLGYGTAKMLEPKLDDDELKAQELAATYKLYADKAKNRKKVRQYRLGRGSS
jgi:hypothetical protein